MQAATPQEGMQAATPPASAAALGRVESVHIPALHSCLRGTPGTPGADSEGLPQQQCMPLGTCHWHRVDPSAKHGVRPCLRVDGHIDQCGAARLQCLPQRSLCDGQWGGLRAVRDGSGGTDISSARLWIPMQHGECRLGRAGRATCSPNPTRLVPACLQFVIRNDHSHSLVLTRHRFPRYMFAHTQRCLHPSPCSPAGGQRCPQPHPCRQMPPSAGGLQASKQPSTASDISEHAIVTASRLDRRAAGDSCVELFQAFWTALWTAAQLPLLLHTAVLIPAHIWTVGQSPWGPGLAAHPPPPGLQ